ncbi:unnamed protein product [Diabrotica balteata]|uniref:FGFR1 oncogene partner (FOP) N-terminal dimerisation domain-containing protein n=1 Tax=Diabrotica balteata TaxID=107213 RepID=A0A9N9X9Y4_DIABA|nr:unnamed protein product [Diabrotica balteata]
MSVEEEIELKDLIAQTLNTNGTLAKIKAQLRASIFLALDEDEKPLLNNKIKTFMETSDGKSMFYLVHEFLEFFNLCFTLAVYEPESYIDCDCQREEKQRIAQQFGLKTSEEKAANHFCIKSSKLLKSQGGTWKLILMLMEISKMISLTVLAVKSKAFQPPETFAQEIIVNEHSKVSLEIPNGIRQTNLNCTFDVLSPILNPKT